MTKYELQQSNLSVKAKGYILDRAEKNSKEHKIPLEDSLRIVYNAISTPSFVFFEKS